MQEDPGPRRCFLCSAPAPYRCPSCRERSCSLPCYKKHKEQCTPKVDPTLPRDVPQDDPRTKPSSAEGGSFAVDDILTEDDEGDKVPLHKLQRLGGSVELGGLLRNPHLRQLLLRVDGAADKSALLREFMQEPLFAEFADCCLRIVEPPPPEEEEGALE
ncbi:zinc finger HIT domain-containing protein 3 [Anolis carolinensis]|uniref:HIT-type domain-containing protein n=1 Tax=Anolis carolinensis TaxID=28377 RepID=H9GF49_ANOCA|nr:PREDICTED: zinc finger HIT domain-containing protein 3 [Anolis carolinensis]|eukprot:XP_003230081.2 PREDICTED: zinc finger HIT domain-containing protein 3 [Anolis carolinensis]